jgi:RNA polymerase sigma-32 factor
MENTATSVSTTEDRENRAATKDSMQWYLEQVGRYDMLSREQEYDLALRVQEQGDPEAASALITANLRLVVKIASDFNRTWRFCHPMDLTQEGNMGLMQAAYKYDITKEVKFSYYAAFWIRAYMMKYIIDNWSLVKVGTTQAQRRLFFNLKKERERLAREGYAPEPEILSKRLRVRPRDIDEMAARLEGDVYLDAPLDSEGDRDGFDVISDHGETVETRLLELQLRDVLRKNIKGFLDELAPRERDIVQNRLLSDRFETLENLANRHGISRERVRQIEKSMVGKLRVRVLREVAGGSRVYH